MQEASKIKFQRLSRRYFVDSHLFFQSVFLMRAPCFLIATRDQISRDLSLSIFKSTRNTTKYHARQSIFFNNIKQARALSGLLINTRATRISSVFYLLNLTNVTCEDQLTCIPYCSHRSDGIVSVRHRRTPWWCLRRGRRPRCRRSSAARSA